MTKKNIKKLQVKKDVLRKLTETSLKLVAGGDLQPPTSSAAHLRCYMR